MSFSKPPVVASSIALIAALSLVSSQGWARDSRRAGDDVIVEMAPMSSDASQDDLIFEMAPLKPMKGYKRAQRTAPGSLAQPAPAIAAQPAPPPVATAAPAPQAAPTQPAPVPVVKAPQAAPVQQPVADASAPASDRLPVAAEAPTPAPQVAAEAAPQGEPVAVAPAAEGAASAPADSDQPAPMQETAEGVAPPEAGQAAANPEQPAAVAEAPALVEPAPIGPPLLSVNLPRKGVDSLKAPAVSFGQRVIDIQAGSAAPGLAPVLASSASKQPAPRQVAAEQPVPAQAESAHVETQPQGLPAEQGVVETEAAGRIAAILAEAVAGPAEVRIADRATMWLPAGRVFLPLESAKKLAKEAGLELRPSLQGMVAPTGGQLDWLAPVELLDDGFIKPSEPAAMAPDRLLAAFQASLPEVNAQRARTQQPPVTLDGWLVQPTLNEKHRLAGCVNISTPNGADGLDRFFNCEAWALGRRGAIKVGVADGGELAARLKDEAAAIADTIVFDRGQTYDAFDAAADAVAPYAVADLLTRDVGAQKVALTPVSEEGAVASSPGDLISSLFYPAVFGAAALSLYVVAKRRRTAIKDEQPVTDVVAAPAPCKTADAREETPVVARQSLFARMLPTLHARLAGRNKTAVPEPAAEAAPPPAPEVKAQEEKPVSALAGVLGKLSTLRAGLRKDKTGNTGVAEPVAPGPAPTAGEEPVSALRKLAAKMRRTNEEPPAPPVNLARAMRPTRSLPGAATALAEKFPEPLILEAEEAEVKPAAEISLVEPNAMEVLLVEPGSSAPAQAAIETAQATVIAQPDAPAHAGRQVVDEADFGLVEPGDTHAATAAMNASMARREANG